jgi:hypothetical protein
MSGSRMVSGHTRVMSAHKRGDHKVSRAATLPCLASNRLGEASGFRRRAEGGFMRKLSELGGKRFPFLRWSEPAAAGSASPHDPTMWTGGVGVLARGRDPSMVVRAPRR